MVARYIEVLLDLFWRIVRVLVRGCGYTRFPSGSLLVGLVYYENSVTRARGVHCNKVLLVRSNRD